MPTPSPSLSADWFFKSVGRSVGWPQSPWGFDEPNIPNAFTSVSQSTWFGSVGLVVCSCNEKKTNHRDDWTRLHAHTHRHSGHPSMPSQVDGREREREMIRVYKYWVLPAGCYSSPSAIPSIYLFIYCDDFVRYFFSFPYLDLGSSTSLTCTSSKKYDDEKIHLFSMNFLISFYCTDYLSDGEILDWFGRRSMSR